MRPLRSSLVPLILTAVAAGALPHLLHAAPAAPKRPRLALIAVTGGAGYDAEKLRTIEELLLGALQATEAFTVIGQSDINALLTAEAKKQAAGCTDSGCMAEIAGALGTEYVATASVGRLDKVTVLSIKVIDAARTVVVARATRTVRSGDKLVEGTTDVANEIVASMGLAVHPVVTAATQVPAPAPVVTAPAPPPPAHNDEASIRPASEASVATTPVSTVAAEPLRRTTVAVLYFDYDTTNESLIGLRKGLAQMLISDLSNVSGVVIVERARLQDILAELQLTGTQKIDPATAARVGKLLGARYLVMGGYFELMGQLRVDARIVEVETGRVVRSVGANCAPDRFMDLEQKLAEGLGATLTDSINPGSIPVSRPPPINPASQLRTMTVSRYGDALNALDQGDKAKAREALEVVVKEAPTFTLAAAELERI